MTRASALGRLAEPATRLIAVAVAVGVLVVLQVVVLAAGGVRGSREADRALDDSFAYLADVSEERVVSFSDAAVQVTHQTAQQLVTEDPGVTGLIGLLHGAVTSRSQVDAVSVTYINGEYAEVSRSLESAAGYSSHLVTNRSTGGSAHLLSEYDVQMRSISSETAAIRWDARDSGCYERATRAAAAVWSDPEVNPLTGRVRLWVCESVRDGYDNVTAVVAASINLDELGDVLNQLPSGSDGAVYLLSADRAVLAAPVEEASAIDVLTTRLGLPTPARFAGVDTTDEALVGDVEDVFGSHRGKTTLERGLGRDHLEWVVHLRATEVGVNEAFTRLRSTVIAIVVGLVAITLGMGYLLSTMWGPLKRVRDVAERDQLTGLYNRHHVEARIARALAAAHRAGSAVAVVMLDLDNFKELNDDLGHSAGDAALADISSVLSDQTRADDIAVRWGGDEFLVVMRLASADDAAAAVERIRAQADGALQDRFRGREGLGITAGFAVSEAKSPDVEALIASADAALVDGKWVKKGATYSA